MNGFKGGNVLHKISLELSKQKNTLGIIFFYEKILWNLVYIKYVYYFWYFGSFWYTPQKSTNSLFSANDSKRRNVLHKISLGLFKQNKTVDTIFMYLKCYEIGYIFKIITVFGILGSIWYLPKISNNFLLWTHGSRGGNVLHKISLGLSKQKTSPGVIFIS